LRLVSLGEVTMRNVIVISESGVPMNWARAAAFIVPVITLAGAVITAAATFGLNQWAARRERLARASMIGASQLLGLCPA
jgi:hypothetical protein